MDHNCSWPWVPPSCETLLKDIPESQYYAWQKCYAAFGIATSILLLCLFRNFCVRGTITQRTIFPFLSLVPPSFIIRAVDPAGEGAVLPFSFFALSEAVGNCCLFTIAFIFCVLWFSLAQTLVKPGWFGMHLKAISAICVGITWMIILSVAILTSLDPWKDYSIVYGALFSLVLVLLLIYAAYIVYMAMPMERRMRAYLSDTRALSLIVVMSSSVTPHDKAEEWQQMEKMKVALGGNDNSTNNVQKAISSLLGLLCPSLGRKWDAMTKIMKSVLVIASFVSLIALADILVIIICFSPSYSRHPYEARYFDAFRLFAIMEFLAFLFFSWLFWTPKQKEGTDDLGDLTEGEREEAGLSSYYLEGYLPSSQDSSERPSTVQKLEIKKCETEPQDNTEAPVTEEEGDKDKVKRDSRKELLLTS